MRGRVVFPFLVIALFSTLAFFAPDIAALLHIHGDTADLAARFLPPSRAHIFGTDELGRDIFVRLLYGGRVSLGVGFTAAAAAAVLGTAVGLLSGYKGGGTDALLMRLTDMLIALPLLVILSAVDMHKLGFLNGVDASFYKIVALVGLTGWAMTARLVRARTLTLREMDFVTAARALGVRPLRLVLRHILPNLMDTVSVAAALSVGNFILLESALSFLGFGIQPPLPSWGNMLTGAEDTIWTHASVTVYPGMMIFITVLAFNFLADGLQGGKRV